MNEAVSAAQGFVEARDFLLRHRTDYDRAYREFAWPKLDTFNWALDYFDVMARGNDNPALWIVDDPQSGGLKLSFAQMSERSSRMANFLRGLGIVRGDRLLLMLPNRVELWDVMLGAMKLGAATCVVVDAAELHKFDSVDASVKRIAVGAQRDGWVDLAAAYDAPAQFAPDGLTKATDPLLLYFTSGTTSKPKLVEHTHQSYPVGHLSTMYWIGLQPGDIHWNISSPGWAKHAWSCFFAPWNA